MPVDDRLSGVVRSEEWPPTPAAPPNRSPPNSAEPPPQSLGRRRGAQKRVVQSLSFPPRMAAGRGRSYLSPVPRACQPASARLWLTTLYGSPTVERGPGHDRDRLACRRRLPARGQPQSQRPSDAVALILVAVLAAGVLALRAGALSRALAVALASGLGVFVLSALVHPTPMLSPSRPLPPIRGAPHAGGLRHAGVAGGLRVRRKFFQCPQAPDRGPGFVRPWCSWSWRCRRW